MTTYGSQMGSLAKLMCFMAIATFCLPSAMGARVLLSHSSAPAKDSDSSSWISAYWTWTPFPHFKWKTIIPAAPLPSLPIPTSIPPLPNFHFPASTPPRPSLHFPTSTPPFPSLHFPASTPPRPSVHFPDSTPPRGFKFPPLPFLSKSPPTPSVRSESSSLAPEMS
ncbi:hypothetical protein MPTK2_3g18540 [Marchantia polymorpha subsp. ruderalis]